MASNKKNKTQLSSQLLAAFKGAGFEIIPSLKWSGKKIEFTVDADKVKNPLEKAICIADAHAAQCDCRLFVSNPPAIHVVAMVTDTEDSTAEPIATHS